jgi:hypothetical protein
VLQTVEWYRGPGTRGQLLLVQPNRPSWSATSGVKPNNLCSRLVRGPPAAALAAWLLDGACSLTTVHAKNLQCQCTLGNLLPQASWRVRSSGWCGPSPERWARL